MKKVINTASLAEQAYALLKKGIVSGELAPEKELPEVKLAEDLGVSRTPLREAIQRLAMEGLVSLNKGKPATVATFTKEDSLEFIELRQLLEIYNIERIIQVADSSFIEKLEVNLDDQLKAIANDDYPGFTDADRQFHLILASQNPNSQIQNLIRQMNTGVNRAFLILSNTMSVSAKDAFEEHKRILGAIKVKDAVLAKKEMTEHLRNVEKRFLYYSKGDESV